MATANNTLRRRAAWAVLAPVMEEEALIEALWLQHDSMRGDTVSDIIGYIDAVSTRHLLDAATRKRLYSAYFDALRQPEETLPIDPWPLMLLARPTAAAPMAQPAQRYVPPMQPVQPAYVPPVVQAALQPGYGAAMPQGYAPAMRGMPGPGLPMAGMPMQGAQGQAFSQPMTPAAQPMAPVPAAAPVAASPATEAPATVAAPAAANPAQAVFASLASGIISGVRQFHPADLADLLADCRARLDGLRLPAAIRQGARDALTSTDISAWYLDASQEQLSTVVHEMYVSLCEAVGPVGADQVLVHAVRQAEQRPEARQVPPSRFL